MINAVLGNGATGKIIVINTLGADTSDADFNFCTRPNAPTASNTTICNGTSVTLTATGVGVISWYTTAIGGTKLTNGNSYTTPILNVATTYYMQDSTCAASATRTAVTVSLYATVGVKQIQSACDSFVWYGTTFKNSGTYVQAHTNSNGCASPDTLILTINSSAHNAQTIVNCGAYLWNGNTYNNSGDYVYAYTNASGCASSDTLHLTIYCPYNYVVPSNIDAGFENQTTGNLASANPNTSATNWSFVTSGNGQVKSISGTSGYGGPKFLSVGKNAPTTNTSTTVNSNILSTNTFLQNTKYIAQFHYKRNLSTPDTASFVFISMDGTSGARDQSSISLGTPTTWTNFSRVITTNSTVTPTANGVAGINIKIIGSANGSNSAVVDVDNFVVYPADNQTNPAADTAAPQSPTSFTLNGSNTSVSLNWSAPSLGTDGGGYMVLRYTSNTNLEPNPLQNAVYATGGQIGNGLVVYQGSANSFTDANLTACNAYWYRVYSRDKAYNYSSAISGSCIASSLNNFNPLQDSIITCNTTQTLSAGSGFSSYLWSNGNTQNSVTVNQSGKYKVTVTSGVGCTNSDSVYVVFKSSSSSITAITSCSSVIWNGQAYSQSGTYTFTTTNAVGCDSLAILQLTINNCQPSLTIRALFEGYYAGNGRMSPVLYELGLNNDSMAVDSVEVSLWHPDSLNDASPSFRNKYIISAIGNVAILLPGSTLGKSFYISIKTRNSVETWSALPVNIALSTNYDFTDAITKAYSDGYTAPMKQVGSNLYACYSGDVNADGGIDLLDLMNTENDASEFQAGYILTDCNGDGVTDLLDLLMVENNASQFIFIARPY